MRSSRGPRKRCGYTWKEARNQESRTGMAAPARWTLLCFEVGPHIPSMAADGPRGNLLPDGARCCRARPRSIEDVRPACALQEVKSVDQRSVGRHCLLPFSRPAFDQGLRLKLRYESL